MTDKLASMQAFSKVVEMGSFSRASEALGLSRSMTTTHVARLEEHLGVRLLNRTTRRLSLTEAGSAYYAKCSALLAEIETLEASLVAMSEQPRGVIKISAPVTFGSTHLGEALAEFLDRHPKVRLDVSLNDRIVDIVEEGYDVAIRISRMVDSSLVARRIASTHLKACASPAYIARRGAPARPGDLAEHDCLGYAYLGSGNTWEFEGPEGAEQVRVRTETRANNDELLRTLALHGHGIVLLPAFQVPDDLASGTLVELLPGYRGAKLDIQAVYPTRKYVSAKVRVLLDFLVEWFATTPAKANAKA